MRAKSRFDSYLFVLLVSVILLLPLWTKSSYVISVMIFVAIFGVLTVGMGVLLEQAGLFSLAHPSWFALGAYAAGILAVRGILPPWAAMLAGAFGVGVLSYFMGLGLLRLKGYYLACATFALLLIVVIVLGQMGSLTGGHEGLMGVPPLSMGGFVFQKDIHYYYLGWALCLGCLVVLSNIMNGRVGRAIKAFRDSELAAKSLGVNVLKYKLQIFVLTAVMASLNGSIFCFYLRFANPEMYSFPLLIELITMLVIGGGMKVYGPLLGCFVTLWVRELIHLYLGDILRVLTAEVDAIFFGVIIVVILIFMPGGLTGWLEQALRYGRKAVGQA